MFSCVLSYRTEARGTNSLEIWVFSGRKSDMPRQTSLCATVYRAVTGKISLLPSFMPKARGQFPCATQYIAPNQCLNYCIPLFLLTDFPYFRLTGQKCGSSKGIKAQYIVPNRRSSYCISCRCGKISPSLL